MPGWHQRVGVIIQANEIKQATYPYCLAFKNQTPAPLPLEFFGVLNLEVDTSLLQLSTLLLLMIRVGTFNRLEMGSGMHLEESRNP